MKLIEMIGEVDAEVPNTFNITDKIRYINQTMRQVYTKFSMEEKKDSFTISKDTKLYDLPSDCLKRNIIKIVVDDNFYSYSSTLETKETHIWTIETGKIKFVPDPVEERTAELFYKPQPALLTKTDLENEVDFIEDYEELLVLGCSFRVARKSQDIALSEKLEQSFYLLLDRASKDYSKTPTRRVNITQAWM